jgi:hypothetical protein
MPFDAMTETKKQATLERIGLMPVPHELVTAHKRDVEKAWDKYTKKYPKLAWRPTNWQTLSFYHFGSDGCGPGRGWRMDEALPAINQWLRHCLSSGSGPIFRAGPGVPDAVADLASQVHDRLDQEAIPHDMRLEVFNTDPILSLVLEPGPRRCLAIWDIDGDDKPIIQNLAKLFA